MTDKTRRQGAILRLIRERAISTQSELVDALRAAGHEVVQTTVSRDVHELGLRKVRTGPASWPTRRPMRQTPTASARSVQR